MVLAQASQAGNRKFHKVHGMCVCQRESVLYCTVVSFTKAYAVSISTVLVWSKRYYSTVCIVA